MAVVLENDQFFGFTGPLNGTTSSGAGDLKAEVLVQGQGASTNPNFFVAVGRRYSAELNGSAQFEATYTADTSISGSVYAFGYPNVTYSGAKPVVPASARFGYTYDAPADTRLFSTSWVGSGVDNNLNSFGGGSFGVNIAISSTGDITTALGPCNVTGTAVTRSSGKNIFDVTLTYSTSPAGSTVCPFASKSVKGIALWYFTGLRSAQLLIGTTTPDGSSAIVLSGTR